MVEAVEEDLGFALVQADGVRDLGGPDLAALMAAADRERAHDGGVVRHRGVRYRDHLLIRVVAGVSGGVVNRADAHGRTEQQDDGERQDESK